jgi:hypothetical protein
MVFLIVRVLEHLILQISVISCSNSGTGIFVGMTNSAAVSVLNLNNNIVRNLSKSAASGTSNTAVLSSISINGNQLGNDSGGLITYSAANSATLLGISNTSGTAHQIFLFKITI